MYGSVFFIAVLVCAAKAISRADFEESMRNELAEKEDFVQDCMKLHSMTPEMLAKMDFMEQNPKENEMCFFKCFYEKLGFIKENGDIDLEIALQSTTFKKLENDSQKIMKDCIMNVGPMKVCSDMKKYNECFKAIGF